MDRCRATFLRDEVTWFGIEGLLPKGQVQIECINPLCDDRSWFPAVDTDFGFPGTTS